MTGCRVCGVGPGKVGVCALNTLKSCLLQQVGICTARPSMVYWVFSVSFGLTRVLSPVVFWTAYLMFGGIYKDGQTWNDTFNILDGFGLGRYILSGMGMHFLTTGSRNGVLIQSPVPR